MGLSRENVRETERERFFTLSLDMLCISSADGYFKHLSPAFTRTLGWSVEELLARPFIDFVHPDDRAATLREVDRQTAAGEKVLQFENRYLHKDGSWRTLSWRSVPYEGGTMYATARDVTEQHRARAELVRAKEDAEAADRAKSAFLATMSHEIRTPLNGVLGMLELLGLTQLDADQRASLEVVRRSGESLRRIIDDILEFSRIESGRLEICPEPTSLAAMVAGVRDIYSSLASAKGLAFVQRVDRRISPALAVDAGRLQQILNNLASNALKFTLKGRVAIAADLVARSEAEDTVRFTVEDTGIGIAPADVRRLFQPFMQGERDTTRRFGGSGLGLAISRRLAELMGGTLDMASEPGVGTTVTLVLPLRRVDPGLLAERQAGAGSQASRAGRPAPSVAEAEALRALVLVVDDNPLNQRVLCAQLQALGYASETAATGAEGLERWRSGRYALVLADCHMPVMDGYELARSIRCVEAEAGLARTPIVACTANALRGEDAACREAGMDDYLCKPVELAALDAKLLRWLPINDAQGAPVP
jgi:PAS domain S-box-containing protein